MSHIHIPDGILPLWLWLAGYLIIILILIFCFLRIKKNNFQKKLPLISIITALMLLVMSIPIPFPVPYHVNLSILAGILLGPFYVIFSIFGVNLLLSIVAHGGITVVGLNTIVIAAESLLGYYIFHFLNSKLKNIYKASLIATFLALFLSTSLTIGITYAGTKNFEMLDHHHCEHSDNHKLNSHDCEKHDENHHEEFNIKKFFMALYAFGAIGWILEALLTAFIVNYINRVKPELLGLRINETD